MRSLNEINKRHINTMRLMTNIRRTNTLLLFIFMCFIAILSGNFYDDFPSWLYDTSADGISAILFK